MYGKKIDFVSIVDFLKVIVNDEKNKMQQIQLTETQNKVISEFDKLNPRRTVIQLQTSMGKTVIALEIIKKYNYKKMLIVANTVQLVNQWEDELLRSDIDIFNTKIITIQSAYKFQDLEFDLLIVDEGHHLVAPQFLKLLQNNKFKDILILTPELPRDDERHLLLKDFQITTITNKSYETGIKEKLISDFQIINVGVQLTENEKIQITKIENFINKHFQKFNYNYFEVKNKIKSDFIASELFLCFQKRKQILNNAVNKIQKVEEIIMNEKWNKCITYCEYIDFANWIYDNLKSKIKCCIYHSKIKDKEKVLQDFKDNKYDLIVSVKSLDEGMNIPNLDLAIIVSSSSQERQTIQRIGRVLRYKEDKIATIFNLYVEDSKEEAWLKQRISSFDRNKIFWR